jgi:hypothetical protein
VHRREAIGLFREITERTSHSLILNGVQLIQEPNLNNFRPDFGLQITADLDPTTLESLISIVRRHRLDFEARNGCFFIHSKKQKTLLITKTAHALTC